MKYRTSFVTNSSSSSFICEICGQDASGYDMSLEDAQMCMCLNGHTFCTDHLLEDNDTKSIYDINPLHCPICQFKTIHTQQAFNYLMKKNGYTDESLLKEMKEFFGTYEKLIESQKEKK
jgi:ribosome-binding protein aMBF1 (putative translation factor)